VFWQAVGLAQMITKNAKPRCYGFEREAVILKLVVSNSHVLQMDEARIPIFFYWENCRDNVLSEQDGVKLFMSVNVLDYFPVEIQETEGVFPTHRGALHQCINPRSVNKPIRLIEFHNGGVEYRMRLKDTILEKGVSDSTRTSK
jgi:hypothetical protein